MCVCPIYPSESAVMDEVVELTARRLVDVNKRMEAGRCGQLCYYCTPAKCLQVIYINLEIREKQNKEPQAALQVRCRL